MCFSSKAKTPKTDPESLKAPEPVLLEEPKGVDFGSSTDDQSTATGTDLVKVEKTAKDTGDGSSSATSTDTGTTETTGPKKAGRSSGFIKKAIKT